MGLPGGRRRFARPLTALFLAAFAFLAGCDVICNNAEVTWMGSAKAAQTEKGQAAPVILLNQVGYLPGGRKTAIFRGAALGEGFAMTDESGKTVYTGVQSAPVSGKASGDTAATGDFTAYVTPGVYKITANGQESFPFAISKDAYNDCFHDLMRFFYYQRCGCALAPELSGVFAHGVCHASTATVYGTGETKDVSGGWHDAGDYGRYVVPAAKTVADLLLAYEMNPAPFSDDFNIPESGNGIPDVLDEVRYELEWMLKMQEAATGGVYHKVTCAFFPGEVIPEKETAPLVISPVSTAATGDFAAAMALAARVYKGTDPAFADACLDAAEKAFGYLLAHPDATGGFRNPKGIVTGEYGDETDKDERYWAACELFLSTGKEVYKAYADSALAGGIIPELGWADVGAYGHMAYLLAGDMGTKASAEKIRALLISHAEELLASTRTDGYGISLGMDYPWGSNMTVANHAMLLLKAAELAPDRAELYQSAAWQHLHYLMGANPMGYSYITGYGSLSTAFPHHRPSQAMGRAVNGMLSGGPNAGLHDPYAKAMLTGQPPAKCYVDNDQSYATNEVAIYWNSPLIHVLAGLMRD